MAFLPLVPEGMADGSPHDGLELEPTSVTVNKFGSNVYHGLPA